MSTWYTEEGGSGNGASQLTPWAPGSVVYDGAGVVAGDTLYAMNTITTEIIPTISGSSGNPITIRGDLAGNAAVYNATGNSFGIHILDESYFDILGGEFQGATTANILFRRSGGCSVRDTDHTSSNKFGVQVYADSTTDCDTIDIDGNAFATTLAAVRLDVYGVGASHTSRLRNITTSNNIMTGCKYGVRVFFTDFADAVTEERMPVAIVTEDNIIKYSTNPAIALVGTRDNTSIIRRNTIIGAGTGGAANVNAIQTGYLKDAIIEYNSITGTTTTGTGDGNCIIIDYQLTNDAYASDGVIVRGNFCTVDPATEATYGAGISVFKGTNTQIYGNICANSPVGIKATQLLSSGTEIYNNTVINNTQGMRLGANLPQATIANNILTQNTIGLEVTGGASAPDETYNCFYANTSDGITLDGTDITTNPLLRGDYHLAANSPCCKAGVFIDASITDNKGRPYRPTPSMGAYEYYEGISDAVMNDVLENVSAAI